MSKARDNVFKLASKVYVTDGPYYAKGDGTTDDTAAIQACVDANPGKRIIFAPGVYKVTSAIVVNSNGTVLEGTGSGKVVTYSPFTIAGGSFLLQFAPNVDTVRFEPASNAVPYIHNIGLHNLGIAHDSSVPFSSPTSGAGIRVRRASNYRLDKFAVSDAFESVVIQGGASGVINDFKLWQLYGPARTEEVASLTFKGDVYGSSYQPVYTTEVSNFYVNGNKMRRHAVRCASSDIVHFTGGYIAGAIQSLLHLRTITETGVYETSDSVAHLTFANTYFDCVAIGTGTDHAVFVEDNVAPRRVYNVGFGSGCFFGNTAEDLVYMDSALGGDATVLTFDGATFANATKAAVRVRSGASSQVDVVINDCNIANVGNTATGAIDVGDVRSLTVSGNTCRPSAGSVVYLAGAIDRVALSGNTNVTTRPDVTRAGSVSSYTVAANNSASTAVATTWTGLAFPSLTTSIGNYADDTAAAAAGVPVGHAYRTGSALKVRVA